MKLIALIFGWWVFKPYSVFVAAILRLKGVKIGRNFYIQGVPYLKIRGRSKDIHIGNNVSVYGDIDIRNREKGRIIIDDNVVIDKDCRFVVANNAILHIHSDCRIGLNCIFNCGEDVVIGKETLFAGFCYVQSSDHGIRRGRPIKNQPHTYGKITIGNDTWVGGHVSILKNVSIGDGAVIGAKSVVTKDVPPYSISVGIPAAIIAERI